MVTAFALMLVLWTVVWQALAQRLTGLKMLDMLKDVVPFMLIALTCAGVAWWATRNVEELWLSILLRAVIMGALYVGMMKVAKVKIFDECITFLVKRKK